MKYFAVIVFLSFSIMSHGQPSFNPVLKKQLDSVKALDQKYREALMLLMQPQQRDSVARSIGKTVFEANQYYWDLQNRIDSSNLVFIEEVIKNYGYPGKSLVDTPANETVWFVLQHSPKIHQYIEVIKKAAENNELPFYLYAKMLDRDLMDQGKEQLYGTQGTCRRLKNIADNCIIWPIKDPELVNERRKKAGFKDTVEENAKRLGIAYKVYRLSDVQ